MAMPKDTFLGKNPALPEIDPVSVQVIYGALENVTMEMGHNLARMSYSSIIRESEDFGAALLDSLGRQMAACPISTPLQLGPIPGYLQGMFRYMETKGDEFYPGDVFLHNHPYYGATHGPDFGIGIPVFQRDELVGFSVTTAHVLDLGAHTPGSAGIIDAMDAYAEGLQFIAIKLYEKGKRNEYVWRLLEQNIRSPKMVVGDLEAQVSTARLGGKRFLELIDRFGFENILAASEEMSNYSERMMRQAISKLPKGKYSAEGWYDGYQLSEDPSEKDLKIVVTITVEEDSLLVDLAGTSKQVDHRPFNMPFIGTVDQAIYTTIRSVLLDTALTEYVPQNEGLIKPIKIVAPIGCVANPIFPAPTIGRFCPGNVLSATVMKALKDVAPKNISGGTGNIKVGAYSGTRNGDYWVYMDITEGSYGGCFGKDGMDAVDTLFTNTRNNPIEDIESHFPLRINRYELVEDKAGAGEWRGGVGSIREVQFLANVGLSVEGDGNKYRPWGVFGGEDGTVGSLLYTSAGNNISKAMPSELPHRKGNSGDTYLFISPCGGGYGDPLKRKPELVLSDVLDEYVSLKNAKEKYGVVINKDGTVDMEATETHRFQLRMQHHKQL